MKKKLSLMLAVILILQIMLPMLTVIWENALTLKSIAQENLVTIQFQDENMYNAMVEALGDKVTEQVTESKTIKMAQDNINKVKSLSLARKKINNISGIEKFINLESLNLSSNDIDDLSAISELKKLEHLSLDYVKITDISFLKDLNTLTRLSINQASINTGVASEYSVKDITPLKNLTNLTFLNLKGNKIEDISPLSALTKLTELKLEGAPIRDVSVLSNLTELTTLHLETCNIDSNDLTHISKLTKLKELYLGYANYEGNEITNIDELSKLKELTTLFLDNNDISDITPLKELVHLKKLSLRNNNISDLTPISGLTELIDLTLGRDHYAGKNEGNPIKSLKPIASLVNLTSLEASTCQIDDISVLSKLTKLRVLDLSYNKITHINELLGLKSLTELDLSGNEITDISEIANFTKLTVHLDNNKIDDISILETLSNISFTIKSQDLTTTAIEGQIIDLPPIFKSAKNPDSKGYTEQEFILENCTLSEDKTKITIEKNVKEASVTINGGILDYSTLTITVLPITLTSEVYTVKETRVSKIQPETTVEEFKKNIATNADIVEIYNKSGQKLEKNDTIGTGAVLKLNNAKSYTLIVLGDVDGDSKANFKDILSINKHRLGKTQLTGIYLEAADVTGDGIADFKDILKINKYRLGKISSL